MKKKIGTVMEDQLLYGLKKAALESGEPLSRVIERAVESYLNDRKRDGRDAGVVRGTFGLIKLGAEEVREVMNEPGLFDA